MNITAARTVDLLNAKLGKSSSVAQGGDPANLIGAAVWRVQGRRALTESMELHNFEGKIQSLSKLTEYSLVLLAACSAEEIAALYEALYSKHAMMQMLYL